MFENDRKSLIQHCERSELHLHFELTKVHLKLPKMPKLVHFGEFLKSSNATFSVIFKQYEKADSIWLAAKSLVNIQEVEERQIFCIERKSVLKMES